MDANSWFRRGVSKIKFSSSSSFSATSTSSTTSANTTNGKNLKGEIGEEEEHVYGLTSHLLEYIKSFSFETFKNFSLPANQDGSIVDAGNFGNIRTDLSDWQKTHATLVLSRVKELAQLRFKICPRYMKETQFWRIYFTLVRSYVTQYELNYVRLTKLKQIRAGNETVFNDSASEVEMSEAKLSKFDGTKVTE